MKQVANSLTILIVFLLISLSSGCATHQPVAIKVVTEKRAECPEPSRPLLKKDLNPDEHFGGLTSFDIKQNIILMKDYIEKLEVTIECYKNQTRKK